jgi:hypothetical protein
MRHYQLFPFGSDGRLTEAVPCDLENDARAIRLAIEGDYPFGCELWEGFRFIGRFHGAAARAGEPASPAIPTGRPTLVH